MPSDTRITPSDIRYTESQICTHVAVGVAVDGLFVGISCRTDCRSIGFEPPS
jgi:hypothetical protein